MEGKAMPRNASGDLRTSDVRTSGIIAHHTADISELEQKLNEANFMSRFMAATSTSLDPQDICSIASRHIFDFIPFHCIVFSLADEFGLPTVIFTPGTEGDGKEVLKEFSPSKGLRPTRFTSSPSSATSTEQMAKPRKSGGVRISLSLHEEMGTIQIYFLQLENRRFSSSLLAELTSHFTRILKNALTHAQVKELAMKDSLTGLFNRRVFNELLTIEVRRKELMPISLLLIDLDDFKKINDTFGHPAGDEVLTSVGKILRDGCRGSDLVARYGGEEFAVMLPATGPSTAFEIAQRFRTRLSSTSFVFEGKNVRMTASVGIAHTTGTKRDSLEKLISRADQALYRAKKSGKNMTYIYTAKSLDSITLPEARQLASPWLKSA